MSLRPLEMLVNAMEQFEILDLSSDVADHGKGPFETRMEILEAEPGADFLLEQVMPHIAPDLAGRLRPEHFPGRAFLRHEMVTVSMHAGSHIDAPGHYGGKLSAGAFINDASITEFIAPGIFFDGYNVEGPEICWEHIEEMRRRQEIGDVSGKIVLIRTGSKKAISVQVVGKLLDQGVKVIGTDNVSLDGSFEHMFKGYTETGDASVLWPCHMLGRQRPYYQLENLANLERLPPAGFYIWAPPIRVRGATAGWSRVLALVPKV